MGTFLLVDEITPRAIRSASGSTPALQHPLMEAYLAEMKKNKCFLVIDTSLPFSGAGAYFHPGVKVIAISPQTTWATFMHEFNHFEFDLYVRPHLAEVVKSVRQGNGIHSVLLRNNGAANLARMGAPRLKKLEDLVRKEIPDLGIDETLAVDRGLRQMKWKRYLPAQEKRLREYALKHQHKALSESTAPTGLTTTERLAWERNKTETLSELERTFNDLQQGGALSRGSNSALVAEGVESVYYDPNLGNLVIKFSGSDFMSFEIPTHAAEALVGP